MKFPKCLPVRWSTCVMVACIWLTALLVIRPNSYSANIIPAHVYPAFLINTSFFRSPTPNGNCTVQLQLSPCTCNRTLYRVRCEDEYNNTSSRDRSTCGKWSDLRGPGQKVVSYSLYGKFPGEYHRGLEILLERVKEVYPGWSIRVYTAWSSPEFRDWACNLACNYTHVDFCDIKHLPEIGDVSKIFGMAWRFSVVGDPLVDRYMVRDLDMPILQREVDAIDQWIANGKCYHVMRDNPFHGVPMMGGMWGGCNSWNRHMAVQIRSKLLTFAKQRSSDQPVLWNFMWPLVKQNATIHDSYTCTRFPGSLPFPTQRYNRTFVGMRTYREVFVQDAVWPECPLACRPPQHKDWKLC